MKKPTLTIGIPAYNEEKNIGYLLDIVLKQSKAKYFLKEIIVFNDCSTDQTAEIVKAKKSNLIRLINGPKRQGQQIAQNIILKEFVADYLVILEADTLLFSRTTIDELVKPLITKNSKVGLVVGSAKSVMPTTHVEEITCFGAEIKRKAISEWKNGNNIYSSVGHAMKALPRKFAEELTWPKSVPEDAFAYLRLKELGYKMRVSSKARVKMRQVRNLGDSLTQSRKFVTGKKELIKYFSEDVLSKEYKLPLKILLKHFSLALIKNPYMTLMYVGIVLLNRLYSIGHKSFNELYHPYKSTKKVI